MKTRCNEFDLSYVQTLETDFEKSEQNHIIVYDFRESDIVDGQFVESKYDKERCTIFHKGMWTSVRPYFPYNNQIFIIYM